VRFRGRLQRGVAKTRTCERRSPKVTYLSNSSGPRAPLASAARWRLCSANGNGIFAEHRPPLPL